MKIVNTPGELAALLDGTQIEDGDYLAIKRDGAWFYPRFDSFWEPQHFPVTVLSSPAVVAVEGNQP